MIRNLVTLLWLAAQLLSTPAYATEPPFLVEQKEPIEQTPQPTIELPDQKELSKADTQDKIYVEHVQFQGGTVFELTALASIVQPLINKVVGKNELITVLRQITQKYQDAGYPLSYAHLPAQDTRNGKLTIVIVEGYVARSEVVIEDEKVKKRVQQLAAKLLHQVPLKQSVFERYVRLIESIPGYTFNIQVPEPKTISGATTIRVEQVSNNRIETNIGLDMGDEEANRIIAGLTANSLISAGDQTTFSTLVPDETIDQYFAVSHSHMIGTEGLQLTLSANRFKSRNDDRLFIADVPLNYEETKTRDRLTAGLRYPLTLTKSETWWLGSKLHYLDEQAEYGLNRQDGLGDRVEIEKDLRYSALEFYTQWQKNDSRKLISLSTKLKQGIQLGAQRNHLRDSNGIRKGTETTHFTSWDFTVMWRYMLTPQWRLQTRANLFWSDDILPSAEQVRYGGERYGRGYPDGQAQGDRGAASDIELRYLMPVTFPIIKRFEPYAVVDVAQTELNVSETKQELASVAVGLYVTDQRYFGVAVEVAKPVGDAHYETTNREPVYNLKLHWKFE